MNIEVITERERLEPLRSEWDALARADGRDGFFRTSSWYLTWLECIWPDARPFVIAVRAADGRLLGLAPLCRYRYSHLGFSLWAIGFGGRDVVSGDFLDFLSVPASRADVSNAILDVLWQQRSLWSVLVFGEVLVGTDFHIALESWSKRTGLEMRQQEERICPYLVLPDSFEAYLQHLGSSTRYHIRRRTRELLEKYKARIELCSEPAAIRAGLCDLIRLHVTRWRNQNQLGTLAKPGFARFLERVCLASPDNASARLYLLKDGDKAVAAMLAFHFGESAIYYQTGWDPDSPLTRSSPGVALMAYSIQDAIRRHLRFYEFLRGGERYKFHWTGTYRKTITILLARTALARGYLRIAGAKDLAKQLLQKANILPGEQAPGVANTAESGASRRVAPTPSEHNSTHRPHLL